MVDKLPEEMTIHGKALGSWQELLVDCQMTCCLIVFKCLAWDLWFLLQGQIQLSECILDEALNGDQCLHRVGQPDTFGMSGAQADFGDQL